MKSFLIISSIAFCLTINSLSISATENKEVIPADTIKTIITSISLLVGFPFPAQSTDFIDVYQTYAGGKNEIVRPSVLLSARLMVQVSEHFDMGGSIDYFRASFKDNFSEFVIINDKLTAREFTETINSSHLPINLTLQYTNIRSSYTSYAGLGLGLSFTSITWDESVSSIFANDNRRGGEQFKGNLIAPSIKLLAGTMLNFDKKNEKEFLGAFHFEVSFNYLFEKAELFKTLATQTNNRSEDLQKKYAYIPFYFSLSAGISFNIFPEIIKKNKK